MLTEHKKCRICKREIEISYVVNNWPGDMCHICWEEEKRYYLALRSAHNIIRDMLIDPENPTIRRNAMRWIDDVNREVL